MMSTRSTTSYKDVRASLTFRLHISTSQPQSNPPRASSNPPPLPAINPPHNPHRRPRRNDPQHEHLHRAPKPHPHLPPSPPPNNRPRLHPAEGEKTHHHDGDAAKERQEHALRLHAEVRDERDEAADEVAGPERGAADPGGGCRGRGEVVVVFEEVGRLAGEGEGAEFGEEGGG